MPADFDKCQSEGGRIRTIKPKGSDSRQYMHVCFKGGKSHAGEVKTAKSKGRQYDKK
jgi:hypothetical protein